MRDHLTDDNHEELAAAASGLSKRELQELLAARFPKPDVPSTLRQLPSTPTTAGARSGGKQEAGAVPARATGHIEPLAEARYKLQLTASRELRDKIERATQLMRHRNPNGDLTVVLDRALDLLIAELEKKRLGKTTRPKRAREAKPGHVTQAVRREVFERDGEQCTFVSGDGNRCPARAFLEVDHIHARGLGGDGSASNLRIRCRRHNAFFAEQKPRSAPKRRWSQWASSARTASRTRESRPRRAGRGSSRHVASGEGTSRAASDEEHLRICALQRAKACGARHARHRLLAVTPGDCSSGDGSPIGSRGARLRRIDRRASGLSRRHVPGAVGGCAAALLFCSLCVAWATESNAWRHALVHWRHTPLGDWSRLS